MLVEELETAEMKEVEEMRAETERKRKEYLGYWKSDDGEVELLIKKRHTYLCNRQNFRV